MVAMTNSTPTPTPTDSKVTVAITAPGSGSAYDAVVASYSELDPHQSLSIESLEPFPFPGPWCARSSEYSLNGAPDANGPHRPWHRSWPLAISSPACRGVRVFVMLPRPAGE